MKKNIIVIMSDGMRSDFAMDENVMPVTHKFLKKHGGIKYTNCYTTSTWTLPAQMSLLTGFLPENHGLSDITYSNRRKIVKDLDDCYFTPYKIPDEELLVNKLKAKGYNTKIFSNYLTYHFLAKTHHNFFDDTIFWDFFYHQHKLIEKTKITEPFFWFMYGDDGGHSPYGVFKRDRRIHFDERINSPTDSGARAGKISHKVLSKLVRSQLKQFDEEKLSLFWKWFLANGLEKNTVVFILSDHGECYDEHNWTGHVANCYEPIVKIPLFMYHPDINELEIDNNLHSICDIMPTILDVDKFGDGKNLCCSDNSRVVFFEFTRDAEPLKRKHELNMQRLFIRGLRHGKYKYLYQRMQNGSILKELHDLDKNPKEILKDRIKDTELIEYYQSLLEEVYEI